MNLDKKVSEALVGLSARVDNTNATLSIFAEQINKVRGPPVNSNNEADSAMNIIITGIPEDRDPIQWRNKVEDVLQFVVGHQIEAVDMFRVGGRFQEGRTRPILVKLRSVWDRRMIISSRRKLKDYSIRVFIHEDEPLDISRKKTMQRLQRKAEAEGKSVNVVDGSLMVDGSIIFSLQTGYIRR
jgi:hypothetical protein